MERIQLIHWNAGEAQQLADQLRQYGYLVISDPSTSGPNLLRRLREDPPGAVVIVLDRLPSQGRDVAISIRKQAATRHVPLVLVGGDPQKVDQVRKLLPDALYTSWNAIQDALTQALSHPPANPVVPKSTFEAYSGRPLAQKLGIKANLTVSLIDAPEDFQYTLGELPPGVSLQTDSESELILWFVRTHHELDEKVRGMAGRTRKSLWIIWPKKTSQKPSDLTEKIVRETGLSVGLVDYKICSVDATWSGLCFVRRKA